MQVFLHWMLLLVCMLSHSFNCLGCLLKSISLTGVSFSLLESGFSWSHPLTLSWYSNNSSIWIEPIARCPSSSIFLGHFLHKLPTIALGLSVAIIEWKANPGSRSWILSALFVNFSKFYLWSNFEALTWHIFIIYFSICILIILSYTFHYKMWGLIYCGLNLIFYGMTYIWSERDRLVTIIYFVAFICV